MNRLIDFILSREHDNNRYTSFVNLLFRCFAGLMMLPYGYSKIGDYEKLSNDFFGDPIGLGNIPSLWLTMFAQLVCPVTLILGFQTRLSAAILAFNMLVATKYHFFDPFITTRTVPMMYLGVYLIIMLWGAGRYSSDNVLYSTSRHKNLVGSEKSGIICVALAFAALWVAFSQQFGTTVSVVLIIAAALLLVIAYNLISDRANG